jgi:ribosomal protein L7/L12
MFAALDFSDFFWIWIIVMFWAGGSTVYSNFKRSDARRLRRMEEKVDLILRHLGLEYKGLSTSVSLSEEVKKLADDPERKIDAIKLHREQTGADLREAKEAVEDYIATRERKSETKPSEGIKAI